MEPCILGNIATDLYISKKEEIIDSSRQKRLVRIPATLLLLLLLSQLLVGGTALADAFSPQPGRDCQNTAYNLFELDENGDIDEAATYFDDTNEPNFSSPPGDIVIDLNGPGGLVDADPPTFQYNYENDTQNWLIWKIKLDGNESVEFDPEADQIHDFPPQQGMLEFVQEGPTESRTPDWILFCLMKAGSLTIRKEVSPNNPQDFPFTLAASQALNTQPQGPLGPDLGAFNLDDDPTNTSLHDSAHFILPVQDSSDEEGNLYAPGPYFVTEGAVAGWGLSSISCVGEVDDGSAIGLDGRQVIIDLDFGENITCTFANTTGAVTGPQLIPTGRGSLLASTGIVEESIHVVGIGLLVAAGLLMLVLRIRGLRRA